MSDPTELWQIILDNTKTLFENLQTELGTLLKHYTYNIQQNFNL